MDVEAFRHAITVGLGRAVLCLREHPWRPHADAIEHVCRHNTAYDPQCEGSRAEYIHEIVVLTDDTRHFAGVAAEGLLDATEHWDAYHLFHLTRLFARDGHAAARAALYEKFERSDGEYPFVGADQLVALDGPDGLLYVTDRIGRWLADRPEHWVDDDLLRESEELVGPQAVAAVREAAASNPNVRRYVDAVEAHRLSAPRRPATDFRTLTYPQLRERIVAGPGDVPRGWLFGWGKRAADDAVRDAAADLLAEGDDRVLVAYLRVFHHRPFPLDPHRLVDLAGSDDDEVRAAALRALRHVRHDAVRSLIVQRLAAGSADGDLVRLLVENFAGGDERAVGSLLDRQRADEDEYHWTAHAAVEVAEAHPAADFAAVMLAVYERVRCSICRQGAVGVLLAGGQAPAWLVSECRHDSNEYVREAVVGQTPRADRARGSARDA
jgi:hypothetical protein